DAMTLEGTDKSPARPMNFGEWEVAVTKNAKLKPAYENVEDIFIGFGFRNRPVLGRVLVSYACMMDVLMSVYAEPSLDPEYLDAKLAKLYCDPEISAATLKWWTQGEPNAVVEVTPYVRRRCKQAVDGGYAKF